MTDHGPRIDRLEEAHAFAERTSEQLSEQLLTAFDRIAALERRIAKLDTKLVELTDAIIDDDRSLEDDVPPHSGKR